MEPANEAAEQRFGRVVGVLKFRVKGLGLRV